MVITMGVGLGSRIIKTIIFSVKRAKSIPAVRKRAAMMTLYTALKNLNQRTFASVNGKGDVWEKMSIFLHCIIFPDLSGNNSHFI